MIKYKVCVYKRIRMTKELGLKQAVRIRKEFKSEYPENEYVVRMTHEVQKFPS